MPPIHREKSLDEYCNNSNAVVITPDNKSAYNTAARNAIRFSTAEETRTKRVSEGSSHSSSSSSSDPFESSSINQSLSSPISKSSFSSVAGNVKTDCLYSLNVTNSSNNLVIHNSASEMKFNNIGTKVNNSILQKRVLNDMKMEMHETNQEHPGVIYAQKDIKTIPSHPNFPSANCQITDKSHFQSTTISNLFQD